MSSAEKKINKRLIWAVIGWALVWAGALSATKKGQSFRQRMFGKAKWLVDAAMHHGENMGKKVGWEKKPELD
jgi:gas vesicle protein